MQQPLTFPIANQRTLKKAALEVLISEIRAWDATFALPARWTTVAMRATVEDAKRAYWDRRQAEAAQAAKAQQEAAQPPRARAQRPSAPAAPYRGPAITAAECNAWLHSLPPYQLPRA